MNERVSIIIPAFDIEPSLLERAVSSASNQTGITPEIIVVDDGSSIPIASYFNEIVCNREANGKIKLVTLGRNFGISRARNEGVAASSGDWLVWLDADDTLASDCVTQLLACSMGRDLVIGECNVWQNGTCARRTPSECFKDASSLIGTADDPFAKNVTSLQPQLISRKAFNVLRGFNEEYSFAEMTELFLRFITTFGIDQLSFSTSAEYNYFRDRENSVSSYRAELTAHRERCLTKYLIDNHVPGSAVRYLARDETSGVQKFQIIP